MISTFHNVYSKSTFPRKEKMNKKIILGLEDWRGCFPGTTSLLGRHLIETIKITFKCYPFYSDKQRSFGETLYRS